MEVVCNFIPSDDEQLSLKEGNILRVIDTIDTEWLLCESGDKQGKVYKACIKEKKGYADEKVSNDLKLIKGVTESVTEV